MPARDESTAVGVKPRLRKLTNFTILRQLARRLRPRLAAVARNLLADHNLLLLNPRSRFGIDYLIDIERLAKEWKFPINTFFDVGANVGQTAQTALQRFPKARVHSFEPHPPTYATLQARLGACPNFCGENVALGATIGSVDMFEYEASTLNSLVPNAPFAVRYAQESRRIKVPCTTLSRYCHDKGIDRVDVLKIDTEGYDLTVLHGSQQMLAKGAIKFVYVEFNDLHPREEASGGGLLPIDAFLRRYGFRFIASYNDSIETEGELFSVSNALFAAPPHRSTVSRSRDEHFSAPNANSHPVLDR